MRMSTHDDPQQKSASIERTILPKNSSRSGDTNFPPQVSEVDLLFIPGKAAKPKPVTGPRPYRLLYYRLGMGLVSLFMLVVAVFSLTGVSFGSWGFDLAASHESNAASGQASNISSAPNLNQPGSISLASLGRGGGSQVA